MLIISNMSKFKLFTYRSGATINFYQKSLLDGYQILQDIIKNFLMPITGEMLLQK